MSAPRQATAVPRGQGGAALVEAAREIFAERGYHGTSTREIARRAGLSLSALYHWHDSKQSLLALVLLTGRRAYLERCHAELAQAADDPAARLGALVAATVDYRITHRPESVIVVREWRNLDPDDVAQLEALRVAAVALWAEVIDDGVAVGVFACPAPDDARRTIEAACNAISSWYYPSGPVTQDELVRRYTSIALRIVDHREKI